MRAPTTAALSTAPPLVFGHKCRKDGTAFRAYPPDPSEIRGPVDREIRCPTCGGLAGIWFDSTKGTTQ